jgi:hypothetical protein
MSSAKRLLVFIAGSRLAADAFIDLTGDAIRPTPRGCIKTQPRPITVSNHRIGSSVGFSGVLEIDARLERIRSHYLVATNSALSGQDLLSFSPPQEDAWPSSLAALSERSSSAIF